METDQSDSTETVPPRVKINQRHCVVCGAPSSSYKGQLFYQTGRTKFGVPFCTKHIGDFDEYAHPVFENKTAQNLYKYMYPKDYKKKVENKQILYFYTYKYRNTKEQLKTQKIEFQ